MTAQLQHQESVQDFVFAPLTAAGLNLHAVFPLASLPTDVLVSLNLSPQETAQFNQLIVIGNAGRSLWEVLSQPGVHGTDPIDEFVSKTVSTWIRETVQCSQWCQVFPGERLVALQRLGELAGWHHPSPFWVGINAAWGSWFAYRAVILTDSDLAITQAIEATSPCDTCTGKMCIGNCPAGALYGNGETASERMQTCLEFRMLPGSACRKRCLARNACPIGTEHRYAEHQMTYHYLHSLDAIRRYRLLPDGEANP